MIFSGNKSCFLVSSSSVGRFLPPGFHFSMPGGSIPALSTPQFPLLSSWAVPARHFLPLKSHFSHSGRYCPCISYPSDSISPISGRSSQNFYLSIPVFSFSQADYSCKGSQRSTLSIRPCLPLPLKNPPFSPRLFFFPEKSSLTISWILKSNFSHSINPTVKGCSSTARISMPSL